MSEITALTVRTPQGTTHRFKGRDAWTLGQLIQAGDIGVTPLERPAPRWSAYVHDLRNAGISIETIDEYHAGPFAGRHGRYRLLSKVEVIEEVRE